MLKQGLSSAEAKKRQAQYGKNEITPQQNTSFFVKILHIICELMFLLLIAAAVIYFVLGEPRDGAVMLIFVVGIITIDIVQEWKTDKTLAALKDLSAPHITVIRDGKEVSIASSDLVPGDCMLLCEGVKIPADGSILSCSDFCVDESSLTGEAEGVWKTPRGDSGEDYWKKDAVYAGTLVLQGSATVLVTQTGARTEYGKIGTHVAQAPDIPTPLQKQTASLVKMSAWVAAILFALVGIITYFNLSGPTQDRAVQSILAGITLAMAMIPEEFPVIMTVFLSMGAWRLAKKQSLVRRLPSVETLGAVSVLCVDKTGTITKNEMTVQQVWAPDGDDRNLCETMGLGCENETYDPMEHAMLQYCEQIGITKEHLFFGRLIHEYAFTNELKMMGHVWEHDGEILIAAKGSAEQILEICTLNDAQKQQISDKIHAFSAEGLRVIAVAKTVLRGEEEIPKTIRDCRLDFCGLIGLEDPPRESVARDIAVCKKAGIRVVMITGDNGLTAASIARKIGMDHCDKIITGDLLDQMSDEQLREAVKTASIFSRVIPEHKMRIVKAFRENGEIVAMTGDGVNDAPALKYADIGIAMGKRGSEVSREAAHLILMDDNFSTIVDTVKDGRRIYDNIRKAVGYVFTIHIPIALSSLIAPLMGIDPANLLLLPLHVVLLELVIDPTCSIVLERQPAERDVMDRPPRNAKEKLLSLKSFSKSIIQGLVLFAASFGLYAGMLAQTGDALAARSMGLGVIMLGNLFLVQVNSSNTEYVYRSMGRLKGDKVMWIANIGTIVLLGVVLYTPLCGYLKLMPLRIAELLVTVAVSAAAVLWYELVKVYHHKKRGKA